MVVSFLSLFRTAGCRVIRVVANIDTVNAGHVLRGTACASWEAYIADNAGIACNFIVINFEITVLKVAEVDLAVQGVIISSERPASALHVCNLCKHRIA